MHLTFEWIAAAFGTLAAALWFYASRLETPKELTQITVGDTGFGGELPKLFKAVALQSKWNAYAAACSGVAALFQVLVVLTEK